MRHLMSLLILLLPGALSAQEGFLGVLGGRTAAQLPQNERHFGAMSGAFLQVDLSPHLGFRSEASWNQSAVLPPTDIYSCHDCRRPSRPVDLEYAEMNVQGRLSWATDRLQPLGARVGLALFGGGWLGARVHGQVAEGGNRVADFGHLAGMGVFWTHRRLLVDVSARSYHGERRLVPDGPKRRGSQLVLGIGYRIHAGGEE